jgi:hypothetical protein
MAGFHADAIEQARDLAIRHQPGQLAHERDCSVWDARIAPAGCIQPLLHLKFGMVSALPVQNSVNGPAIAAHNDLRDRSAQNALVSIGIQSGV